MAIGMEELTKMDYPGRGIILGTEKGSGAAVALYFVTGRSEASRARHMTLTCDSKSYVIYVRPLESEEEIIKKGGDPKLLVYPAMIEYDGRIFISNGEQTNGVAGVTREFFGPTSNVDWLARGLKDYSFEPDRPNFTPRIAGIANKHDIGRIAFALLKNDEGHLAKEFYEYEVVPGQGKLATTYTGENVNPLPSFTGAPKDVGLVGSLQGLVEQVYFGLNQDFIVSVAGVSMMPGEKLMFYVKNRASP